MALRNCCLQGRAASCAPLGNSHLTENAPALIKSWKVITEEGPRNVKTYEFCDGRSAEDFHNRRWCSRVLVDPSWKEVVANHGFNPFALRSIRAKILALRDEDPLLDVVVNLMSGDALELKLPGYATISDIKSHAEISWRVARCAQKMVVGEVVVGDSKTLAELAVGGDGHALHVMMIFDMEVIKREIAGLESQINEELIKSTNYESIGIITKLRKRVDALKRLYCPDPEEHDSEEHDD